MPEPLELAAPAAAQLDALNAQLAAIGNPFKLAIVPTASIRLLERNARFMAHETFKNLVANVKRDGGLAQLPFCWYDGTEYHCLSGNHRVKAALSAGIEQILVLYDDRPLTRQEQVAVQLSHNAIAGKDDPAILKELWAEIEDVTLKYYSGLDDKALQELAPVSLDALAEAKIEYRSVTILFLPEEVDRLKAAFVQASEAVLTDEVLAARLADFDRVIDALDKSKASWGVTNAATAFMLILDTFHRHPEDLASGWQRPDGELRHKGQVPIESALGTDRIPAAAAQKLKRLLDRLVAKGEIKKAEAWRLVERMTDAAWQAEAEAT